MQFFAGRSRYFLEHQSDTVLHNNGASSLCVTEYTMHILVKKFRNAE